MNGDLKRNTTQACQKPGFNIFKSFLKLNLPSEALFVVGNLIVIFNTSSSFVRGRFITLFLIGVMLLVFAVQQLTTIWTPKSSLTPLKGTVQSCDIYVTPVSSKNRYGYEAKSQKAELIFYLNEYKKKFALMENIGGDYKNEQYEEIRDKLNRTDSVTVWIKKSEIDYWEPQVFQIETDTGTALNFQIVRFKERPLTIFLLLMGLSCLILPIYVFYPRIFRKRHVEKEMQTTT
jgi:hypothetical protein